MDKYAKILIGVGTFAAVTYIIDVVIRPNIIAHKAVDESKSRRKPVLNIGAGTPDSSLRTRLLGPTLWGDVNMDIATDEKKCGPNNVCYGDINKIPYPNKYFGAVIASHVLEHVDDPDRALAEMRRIADKVYPIVPKWWAPHTWLYHDHKWFIPKPGKKIPIWKPLIEPKR